MKKHITFCLILSFIFIMGIAVLPIWALEHSDFAIESTPVSSLNHDLWYSDYLKSTKSGYTNDKRQLTTYKNQTVISSKTSSYSMIKRMDELLINSDESEELETLDYKPIKFKYISKEGDIVDSTYEGEIKGNNILLSFTNRGNVNSHNLTIPFSGELLLSAGVDNKYKQNKGKSFQYKTIHPSAFKEVITVNVEYIETSPTTVMDKQMELMKYKTSIVNHPGFESYDWHDMDGKLVKTTSEALGASMFLTTEEEAKKINSNNSVDIIMDYLVIAKPAIPNPEEQKSITYIAKLKSGSIGDIFVNDQRQSIEPIDVGSQYIRVSSYLPKLLNKKFPFTDEKFKKSLGSNDFIQTDDPAIMMKAKEIVGKETNAYIAAKSIEQWVYKNLKNKNYGTGMATASEVLKSLSGDCTEHAVLFAALSRSLGIPTRVVGGLVYIPLPSKDKGAFGYHMWNEVYVGEWIQLDATRAGKEAADATHLTLIKTTLDSYKDNEELGKKIMQVVGKLELEILDYSSSTSSFIDVNREAKGGTVSIDLAEIAKNNDYSDENVNIQKINLDRFKKDSNKMIERYNTTGVSRVDPALETDDGYYTKGMSALAEGNADKAMRYFKKSSQLIPKQEAEKLYAFGLKFASANAFSLAKQNLQKAVELNDTMWSPLAQKAIDTKLPKGEYNDSSEMYNLNGYSFANFSQNYPAAILMFDKSLKASPNFDIALLNRGNIETKRENYQEAIQYFSTASRINSTNPYIYESIGDAYNNLNNSQGAISNYQKAITLNSTDKNYTNELGYKITVLKAKQMTRANPKNPLAYVTLGQAALNTNNINVASSSFVKALSLNPKIAAAHSGLAQSLARIGKVMKAETEYNRALAINPSQKDALFGLSQIYKRRTDYNKAIQYISKAIALEPNNSNYILELGNYYYDMGKYDQALLQYSKVKNSMGYYKVGLAYTRKKQPVKASSYFEQSIKSDKYNAYPYVELARMYLKDDNIIYARKNIETAITLNNNIADAYMIIGDIEAREDRKVLAANNYIEAYLLNQTNVEAYNKARQMFEALDQLKDFKFPAPKYVPTNSEKEYIVKLLYNETLHINDEIAYYDDILQNCKYGKIVINTDLEANYYTKEVIERAVNRTKKYYMNFYKNVIPPASLSQLNSMYLDYIWKSADSDTKELFTLNYTVFDSEESRKVFDEGLSAAKRDYAEAAASFYVTINKILDNWDPMVVYELVDASGFDMTQFKVLNEKIKAVEERTEENLKKLKGSGYEFKEDEKKEDEKKETSN